MEKTELLIIGAGAAGISAASAAWEAGCRDAVLTDRLPCPGGILPQCLHEGFGLAAFGKELTGPAYAERLADGLAKTGVRFLPGREILAVTKEKTAVLSGSGGVEEIRFERLILATGSRERTAGSLPLAGTRPAGIFTAGQAQEMINLRHWQLGRRVVILGSGDLGMILARRFTLEGKQVLAVLEQNAQYGGMARNYHRCIEAYQKLSPLHRGVPHSAPLSPDDPGDSRHAPHHGRDGGGPGQRLARTSPLRHAGHGHRPRPGAGSDTRPRKRGMALPCRKLQQDP